MSSTLHDIKIKFCKLLIFSNIWETVFWECKCTSCCGFCASSEILVLPLTWQGMKWKYNVCTKHAVNMGVQGALWSASWSCLKTLDKMVQPSVFSRQNLFFLSSDERQPESHGRWKSLRADAGALTAVRRRWHGAEELKQALPKVTKHLAVTCPDTFSKEIRFLYTFPF